MILANWLNLCGRAYISITGIICATNIVCLIYSKYKNYCKQLEILQIKPITEVFFFSEGSADCREHLNDDWDCDLENCPVRALRQLVQHLASARTTLDICVHFLNRSFIVKEIYKLQRRNVCIRIITDVENQDTNNVQISHLRRNGIQVKTTVSNCLMNHKFAIIDNNILITGSGNWTLQAFFGNCENLMITNQYELIQAYNYEFENLWSRLEYY